MTPIDIVKLDTASAKNRLLILLDMTPCEALIWVTLDRDVGSPRNYPLPVSDLGYSVHDLTKTGVSYPSVIATVLAYDVVKCNHIQFPVYSAVFAKQLRSALDSNQSVVFDSVSLMGHMTQRYSVSLGKNPELRPELKITFKDVDESSAYVARLDELLTFWRTTYSDECLRTMINSMPVNLKYPVLKRWCSYIRGPV